MSSVPFSYDENGNMTSDGVRDFAWDAENRLVRISYGAYSGNYSEFQYDGFGRRIVINEYYNNILLTGKRFQWAGRKMVKSTAQGSNAMPIHYYPGYQKGLSNSTSNPVEEANIVTDYLGSVMFAPDTISSGNGGASFYDLWGDSNDPPEDQSDFGYTGHYFHRRSGLVMAFYRIYDPKLGRWLSRDPMESILGVPAEIAEGANLYSYVSNNPVNLWDPDGLAPHTPYVDRGAAIKDLATDAYNRTNQTGLEAGGALYKIGENYYYTNIFDGRAPTKDEYKEGVRGVIEWDKCPGMLPGGKRDARLHSHNVKEGSEVHSDRDRINTRPGVEEIIVTPKGDIVGLQDMRGPGGSNEVRKNFHGNIFR
jgi:RHS repeat-associated protein